MMNRQRGANYQFVCFGTAATIISKDAALSAGFFFASCGHPRKNVDKSVQVQRFRGSEFGGIIIIAPVTLM
jgi:hypothetical protein